MKKWSILVHQMNGIELLQVLRNDVVVSNADGKFRVKLGFSSDAMRMPTLNFAP
jgi:hypothetical protein